MKQGFHKIFSTVFYKTLILFVIIIIIPVIAIGLLSIRHSTDNIVKQIEKSSMKNLSDRKSMIDQMINEIDNIAKSIVSSNGINQLLRASDLQYKEYLLISNVIDSISDITNTNELIDSIYVYNSDKNYIISDTKYSREDFPDPDIFNLVYENEFQIIRRQDPTKEILSYTWKFQNLIGQNRLNIVININYNRFFNLISEEPDANSPNIYIFSDKNAEILLDSENPKTISEETMKQIADGDSIDLCQINNKKYIIFKIHSDITDWNITYLSLYSGIIQEAQLIKKLIVTSVLIILILSFILAYLSTRHLYKPLEGLVKKIQAYSSDKDLYGNGDKNEYHLLNNVILDMHAKSSELLLKYQFALPYLKQYSIYDMLSGKTFDLQQFTKVLDIIGIRFIHSKYIHIIIDFENSDFTDQKEKTLAAYLSAYDREIQYLLSKMNSYRISIIINTGLDEEGIYGIMDTIRNKFNRDNTELTIFIGALYDNIEEIYLFFHEIILHIEDKFFLGNNRIILTNQRCIDNREFTYDKKLEEEIMESIASHDFQKSIDAMDRMIEKLIVNNSRVDYIKYVYYQVVYNIIHMLDAIGVDIEKNGMKRINIFDNIQKADTYKTLKNYVESIISASISLIEKNKEEKYKNIVNRTLAYIQNNYTNSEMGLEDVANHAALSPRYLNSIFKAETGIKIYEYITKLRMDEAAKLILNSTSQVSQIADKVGYNNIQSFLRLFKKHYYMTPLEYKRKYKY